MPLRKRVCRVQPSPEHPEPFSRPRPMAMGHTNAHSPTLSAPNIFPATSQPPEQQALSSSIHPPPVPTSPHQLTPCQSTEILLAAQATGFTAQERQQVFISGNVPKTERETHRGRGGEGENHTSASTRIMYTLY